MGAVTFILTALVFTVFGMVIMSIVSSQEILDAYKDGFDKGYKAAKEESEIKWVE